jgi:hypothetical protein
MKGIHTTAHLFQLALKQGILRLGVGQSSHEILVCLFDSELLSLESLDFLALTLP